MPGRAPPTYPGRPRQRLRRLPRATPSEELRRHENTVGMKSRNLGPSTKRSSTIPPATRWYGSPECPRLATRSLAGITLSGPWRGRLRTSSLRTVFSADKQSTCCIRVKGRNIEGNLVTDGASMRTMRPRAALFLLLAVAVAWVAAASFTGGEPPAFHLREKMSAAEFERCGLQKLTPRELTALEDWIVRDVGGSDGGASGGQSRQVAPNLQPGRAGETVAFNTSTGKYHCLRCQWALRCTRNCVNIPLTDARQRGVPCRVCGGSCR